MTTIAERTEPIPAERRALVRRGLALNYLTLAYNVGEAVVALTAGVGAGSVALVGFGVDSVVEVAASGAAQWRLRSDGDPVRRARAERRAAWWVGVSFLALALWVAYESAESLWRREAPARSPLGVVALALSAVVMPLLARAKRRVARALSSGALAAEATQTALCAYLSVIALAGVGVNALLGWWWADAVAALAMTPIIAREGVEGLRGRDPCAECACHAERAR